MSILYVCLLSREEVGNITEATRGAKRQSAWWSVQRHIFIALVAVLDADIAAAVCVSVYDIELETAAI